MPFDPIAEFMKWKRKYIAQHGEVPGTGNPIPTAKAVPKTTWKEVGAFGSTFLYTTSNARIDACVAGKLNEMGLHLADDARMVDGSNPSAAARYNNQQLARVALVTSPVKAVKAGAACGKNFVESTSYKRAREKWLSSFPWKKAISEYGMRAPGIVATKMWSDEIYPWNEEFWGYGANYAIARSAAGAVPFQIDLAIESVQEAVADVAGKLGAMIPSFPGISINWEKVMVYTLAPIGLYTLYKLWPKGK